jgi:DNA excision repair protein ERCC-3
LFNETKDKLIQFSEIVQTSEFVYTFKITDLSIWNALAQGLSIEYIFETLKKYSKYDISASTLSQISLWAERNIEKSVCTIKGFSIFSPFC